MSQEQPLTGRQRDILRWVVRQHVETGKPVGSKTLVERGRLPVSPSTVRSDLAELEQRGLLTHPHTSAGRVPTEHGYRLFADELLERADQRPRPFPLDLTALRSEVDSALQATSEQLAEASRLLALVSAPPLETTTIRHVEVLLLQPTVVVVVVITSTGGVTKHIVTFDEPVDPGVANWAREFLGDRAEGLSLGSNVLRQRLSDPELGERERSFLEAVSPAFSHSADEGQRLFVGGTAGALDEAWAEEPNAYRRVLEMLERRASLLEVLRDALDPRGPFVRVGREFRNPSLRDVALVGASYGLSNRTLGVVSLLGPLRMDYATAIDSVRGAARALSSFVEEVYSDN
jgi:heat-inducible transcriptional repressor